ncbi:hypothetical protein, partial [Stenotrophomonas maltophilia]|uniref:hypothetical protein n=1 Tax=Stenotrophomonas maltophilia TaxID=40324 RepID=UPI003F86D0CE
TVVDATFDAGGRIRALVVSRPDGHRHEVAVATVVLAAGGLESTRLLLALQRRQPDRFGGADGPLGRTYM